MLLNRAGVVVVATAGPLLAAARLGLVLRSSAGRVQRCHVARAAAAAGGVPLQLQLRDQQRVFRLVCERLEARSKKQWKRADKIQEQLATLGVAPDNAGNWKQADGQRLSLYKALPGLIQSGGTGGTAGPGAALAAPGGQKSQKGQNGQNGQNGQKGSRPAAAGAPPRVAQPGGQKGGGTAPPNLRFMEDNLNAFTVESVQRVWKNIGRLLSARQCTPEHLDLMVRKASLNAPMASHLIEHCKRYGVVPSDACYASLAELYVLEAAYANVGATLALMRDPAARQAAELRLRAYLPGAQCAEEAAGLRERRVATVQRLLRFGTRSSIDAAWRLLFEVAESGEADARLIYHLSDGCFGSMQLKELLTQMDTRYGIEPSPELAKALVNVLLIEGDTEGAKEYVHLAPGLDLASLTTDLRSLRVAALERYAAQGEAGYFYALWLFERLCDLRVADGDMCAPVLARAAFATDEHVRLLRLLGAAGALPSAATYRALLLRHRVEGDEDSAREVVAGMQRAGVTIDDGMQEIMRADEHDLTRRRSAFLLSQFNRGALGRADGLAAFEKMIEHGRVTRVLTFAVVEDLARDNDWERARDYYRRTLRFSVTTASRWKPPLRGSKEVDLHGASSAIGVIALHDHLKWIRSEIKKDRFAPLADWSQLNPAKAYKHDAVHSFAPMGAWAHLGLGVIVGRGTHSNLVGTLFRGLGSDRVLDSPLGPVVCSFLDSLNPPLKYAQDETNEGRLFIPANILYQWARTSGEDWDKAAFSSTTDILTGFKFGDNTGTQREANLPSLFWRLRATHGIELPYF